MIKLPSKKEIQSFQKKVLDWFEHAGRHDLPWQINKSPYQVWVSEIMLQQTQVNTVIPYFLRFMTSFPSLKDLAKANLNEVLEHWSGLGYYARARNLHKTAQIICEQYAGNLPLEIELLSDLPGIGRSTAGAILSLGANIPAPILDANVKRVLARFAAISGSATNQAVLKQLWALSRVYTPLDQNVANYNQAMMDLGATVCTRSKPNCSLCPLKKSCQAHRTGNETAYPESKKSMQKPKRTVFWLLMRHHGALLLEQRPPLGIWGGLWSPPETPADEDPLKWCEKNFGCTIVHSEAQAKIKHVFSHFELEIQPLLLDIRPAQDRAADCRPEVWIRAHQKPPGGFAAPLKKLLTQLGYA